MTKETAAILAHTLPESQHSMAEVKLGQRGGYSIFSRKTPPLTRLWKNKHITFEQRIAGERLESLSHTAGIYAPTGMALGERVGGGGERKMTERQLEAWSEYFATCKEVSRLCGNDILQTMLNVAVYGCAPMETRLVAVNRRMAAVRDGLQAAHDFLFTSRELTAKI